MNVSARPPERRTDGFDDLLERMEALRAATSTRIARLRVTVDGASEAHPAPGPDAQVEEPAEESAGAPDGPVAAATPPVPPMAERRVIVIDDLSAPPQPLNLTVPPPVPVRAPTKRSGLLRIPTARIRLPSLAVPRPVLVVAGGVIALLVVAGLSATQDRSAAPAAPDAPPVVLTVPDPSIAIAPVVPPPTPEPEPVEAARSVPSAVRIPAIQVDATTVPVGLEADGSMEIPSDVATIGWYDPARGAGVAPGQLGTAVLAGHVDSRTQGAGAFYYLRDLTIGDLIEIVHEDGSTSTWRVVKVTQYPKDELPIDDVFVWEGPPRLALITCGGPFDWTARSYTDNLVVYAEPDLSARPST